MTDRAGATPLYQQVKMHIIDKIHSGELLPASRVPSEHELVRTLNVSRMTANRALKELAAEGLVTRVAGVGTFVAGTQTSGHLVAVTNIADDVRGRGHDYGNHVIEHRRVPPPAEVAEWMGLEPGDAAFHTLMVHTENGSPIQLEDRYVNPAGAPGYGDLEPAAHTPTEYLLANVPLQQVEHTVRAGMPDETTRERLEMPADTPCLILQRRTWSRNIPISFVLMTHAADKYSLSESFQLSRE
ncbi:MAG: UTRA domain-containing protein [Pseudomonadota bacterium]